MKSKLSFSLICSLVAICIILSWIAYTAIIYNIDYNKTTESWNNAGTFGDMFGGFNALVSGLALAGLIVTIWQQKKSLEIQQEELSSTREELKKQTEQFHAQIEQNKLNQKRTEVYHHLERLEYLAKNIEYKEVKSNRIHIGYSALKEILYKTMKLMDCVFPTTNTESKVIIMSDVIDDILNINMIIDDISVWMFSFANLAEKICKDFPGHLEVGSSFLSNLIKEIPMSTMGLLYLYHDTILTLPIIEELRMRGFISTIMLGKFVQDKERRKLFFKMINDNSFIQAPEHTILAYSNDWRKRNGMHQAIMLPIQQTGKK